MEDSLFTFFKRVTSQKFIQLKARCYPLHTLYGLKIKTMLFHFLAVNAGCEGDISSIQQ